MIVVLLFHSGADWFGGGAISIDVFFVLSGFLITGLLLDERLVTGGVRLRDFYARRALRLLPALMLVLGALVLWYLFGDFRGEQLRELRRGIVFTLFYTANIQIAFLGELPPYALTDHMWSLSIEEQFYAIWPGILLLLLWRKTRIRNIVIGVLVVAAASALWRAYLWDGPETLKRVYYATDTRADALLVGCALALYASRRPLPTSPLIPLFGATWLILQVRFDSHLNDFAYHGGLVGTELAAAAIIVGVMAAPKGPTARVLAWKPFVVIGRMSYGLYLWHWPVYIILNADRLGLPWLQTQLVRYAVTASLATLSYVYVEKPALRLRHRFQPLHSADAQARARAEPTSTEPTSTSSKE